MANETQQPMISRNTQEIGVCHSTDQMGRAICNKDDLLNEVYRLADQNGGTLMMRIKRHVIYDQVNIIPLIIKSNSLNTSVPYGTSSHSPMRSFSCHVNEYL